MDLLDDIGRLKRYVIGAKAESPEFRNALQRWLEAMQPRAYGVAVLHETNEARMADRHRRVREIRGAVTAEVGSSTKHGAIGSAIRRVAKARNETPNKVRKLYYAKDVPDPHA